MQECRVKIGQNNYNMTLFISSIVSKDYLTIPFFSLNKSLNISIKQQSGEDILKQGTYSSKIKASCLNKRLNTEIFLTGNIYITLHCSTAS